MNRTLYIIYFFNGDKYDFDYLWTLNNENSKIIKEYIKDNPEMTIDPLLTETFIVSEAIKKIFQN